MILIRAPYCIMPITCPNAWIILKAAFIMPRNCPKAIAKEVKP
jgi:hypothetical protein